MPGVYCPEYHPAPTCQGVPSIKNSKAKKPLSVLRDKFLLLLDQEADEEYRRDPVSHYITGTGKLETASLIPEDQSVRC